MFPKTIFTGYNHTGQCTLNLKLVKKHWHEKARIIKYVGMTDTTYTLVEWYKKKKSEKPRIKLQLSEEDALQLIHDLNLKAFSDPVFSGATIFCW